jgi:uncharacterized protein involved in response to NO
MRFPVSAFGAGRGRTLRDPADAAGGAGQRSGGTCDHPGAAGARAAFAQGVRLAGWDSLRTIRKPIVSILHAAYAFLPIGFLLIAAASLGWVDRSTALHALTVGVIGGAIIAMVTRTALGHSGRRLETGRMEHLAYLCMALAAIVRVAGPIALPALKPEAVAASGILWALSLVLYLVKYTPYLTRARIDGKEG